MRILVFISKPLAALITVTFSFNKDLTLSSVSLTNWVGIVIKI